jgi:type IV pilus assembly protein PilC
MKYLWKGLRSGEFESGVVDALTRDEAVFLLKEKNVIITDLFCDESTALVDKKTKTKTNISFFSRKHKITEKQLLLFTRKLSAMLSSGLPVVPALEMLRDQSENEGIKAILSTIVEEVNAGVSISKSFEKFPDTFDSVYLNLIKAGESSGSLEKFLDKICQSLEKKIKIMSSLRSALTYPIILLVVAIGVIIVMMTFVVPVFAEMYSNMGKALPLPTQIIMDISNFIRSPISLLFVILLFIFFILFKTRMSKSLILKRKVDEKLLKLPVFGDLIRN